MLLLCTDGWGLGGGGVDPTQSEPLELTMMSQHLLMD